MTVDKQNTRSVYPDQSFFWGWILSAVDLRTIKWLGLSALPRPLSVLDLIAGEMLLVPGVQMKDHGNEEMELHVGGKSFAHMHGPDRIELRLPPDLKEFMITQGTASRSPEVHDREGWVILKLGPRPDLRQVMRIFHQSYQFASSTI